MRFVSSLFLQQATGKGGAIVEAGDAEIILPPIYQSVLELGSPLTAAVPTTAISRQTFVQSMVLSAAGAAAAASSSFTLLGTGLWHITGNFSAAFTGTTDVTVGSLLQIVEPGVGNAMELAELAHITGNNCNVPIDVWLSTLTDGWLFRIFRAPTVALDALRLRGSFLFNKIL